MTVRLGGTLLKYQTMHKITFSILLWLILRSRRLRGRLEGMLVKLLCCRYKRSNASNFRNTYKNDAKKLFIFSI